MNGSKERRDIFQDASGPTYCADLIIKMKRRIEYEKVAPDAYKALSKLSEYINGTSLDKKFVELIRLRVSQLNGCAYCIGYHGKNALKMGESMDRVLLVSAWRRAQYFTDKEKAGLAWAEALTMISADHVPDEVYEEARKYYDEKELVDLSYVIVSINAWNRISTSMRDIPE